MACPGARRSRALARLSPDRRATSAPARRRTPLAGPRRRGPVCAATLGDAATLDALARDAARQRPERRARGDATDERRVRRIHDRVAARASTSSDHQLLRTAATMMPAPAEARSRQGGERAAGVAATAHGARLRHIARCARGYRPATGGDPAARARPMSSPATRATSIRESAPRRSAVTRSLGRCDASPRCCGTAIRCSRANLSALPTTARHQMADGATIELELLVNDAPVAVARFAALARGGYYNGLTFHRIAPNFVVQGGSPGANEYVGVSRYMRDEIGATHLRGAVGISTRGRDTGDATDLHRSRRRSASRQRVHRLRAVSSAAWSTSMAVELEGAHRNRGLMSQDSVTSSIDRWSWLASTRRPLTVVCSSRQAARRGRRRRPRTVALGGGSRRARHRAVPVD